MLICVGQSHKSPTKHIVMWETAAKSYWNFHPNIYSGPDHAQCKFETLIRVCYPLRMVKDSHKCAQRIRPRLPEKKAAQFWPQQPVTPQEEKPFRTLIPPPACSAHDALTHPLSSESLVAPLSSRQPHCAPRARTGRPTTRTSPPWRSCRRCLCSSECLSVQTKDWREWCLFQRPEKCLKKRRARGGITVKNAQWWTSQQWGNTKRNFYKILL